MKYKPLKLGKYVEILDVLIFSRNISILLKNNIIAVFLNISLLQISSNKCRASSIRLYKNNENFIIIR